MQDEWIPITDLTEQDFRVDTSDIEALTLAWFDFRSSLEEKSRGSLQRFEEKLYRKWSIETGIIERIYDIDRGTTQLLIEHGFVAGVIERGTTDKDPEHIIYILKDHEAAVSLIHDCVAGSRELTMGLIHELHAVLTRHQTSVSGEDQFGKPVEIELEHGKFKLLPNNPSGAQGVLHYYCPPEQVAPQMEELLRLYTRHQSLHTNVIKLAAWFHHRFSQIHPYQDGNGRVARALASLILIKGQLFPLVVSRDQRAEYITALEGADSGTLGPLVRLFADIEKKTMLEAMSLPREGVMDTKIVSDVADAIASKLRRRREQSDNEFRSVNMVAEHLIEHAAKQLESLSERVLERVRYGANRKIGKQIIIGGPNRKYNNQPTEHWYRHQVAITAASMNQRVNFDENHYFVRLRISGAGLPWLTFVLSFHHVGQELTGVMEATCFAQVTYNTSDRESEQPTHIPCIQSPFTLTHKDDGTKLEEAFDLWLNEAFTVAVREWGDFL